MSIWVLIILHGSARLQPAEYEDLTRLLRWALIMQTYGRKWQLLLGAFIVICLFAAGAEARSHRRRSRSEPEQTGGTFSYYLLALSYAPDFCAQSQGNKDPRECGAGRHVGFVVHGLWPQGDTARGPERCGSASPVSQDLVRLMLNYMPTESLIQHEWANHGTCSGLSAADYFAAVRKTRDSITLPTDLKQPGTQLTLSPAQIEAKLAVANPRFPKDAFRVSCYGDAELQEARICFNKDLSPRACSASAGECAAPSVTMLPVR